nr:hypothetical protein [Mycoplasmopsis bovis]
MKDLMEKYQCQESGNSFDNREIEYFFSVLKTEMFENFEKSVKKMTLNGTWASHIMKVQVQS